MSNTTTDAIASIKRRGSIPTAQNLFQTEDFLSFLNDELLLNLVPQILSTREDYFKADYDITIVPGQTAYTIPPRALGGKLADVSYVTISNIVSVPWLEQSELKSTTTGPFGFYIKGNKVVLSPPPTNADTLRLSIYQSPGELVSVDDCAQVASIDSATQVTVSSIPTSWTTGTIVDWVKAKPGFENLEIDSVVTGVSGTSITFTSVPEDLEIGDWLCPQYQSCIPQVPKELHNLLAQMVAVKCMEAMGKNTSQAEEKLQMMKQQAFELLSPRVDNENRKIMGSGILNAVRGW